MAMSLFLMILFSCYVNSSNVAEININSANDNNWYRNFVDLTGHDSIFIWKYEITNEDYSFFLEDLYKNDKHSYEICRYDTTKFRDKMQWFYDNITIKNYHTHFAFAKYPIVNISLVGAKLYCDWLTKIYMNGASKKFKNVYFRLPSESEAQILLNEVSNNKITDFSKASGARYYANLTYLAGPVKTDKNYPCDGGFYAVNVFQYKQSRKGLCSVIGNVAELTNKGKVYGGSFDDFFSEINSTSKYSPPDPRIGFRVVMEVISQ